MFQVLFCLISLSTQFFYIKLIKTISNVELLWSHNHEVDWRLDTLHKNETSQCSLLKKLYQSALSRFIHGKLSEGGKSVVENDTAKPQNVIFSLVSNINT